MAEVKRVTEPQLADLLKGFRLAVRTEDGGLVNGEIHVPDNVALHVFRSVSAAREDEQGAVTVTREQLASLINAEGVKITRGDLWGALQRIPPTGKFATHLGAAPYAQALLLSILASRECESCRRADNGGGYPCGCPAACGARYCQHPVEDGSDEQDPWANPPDVHVHCEHAPASRAAYELEQADRIVEMLGRLPQRHVKRILRWAWDYLTDGDEPPF